MNIQEYISSGILEAYALGELSDIERKEVEQNLRQYPALREELRRIEDAQEEFLMASSIRPPADARQAIMQRIAGEQAAAPQKAVAETLYLPVWWRYAAAAFLALAIVNAVLAYNYWSKWKKTENEYTELLAQNQQMAQDINRVNHQLDQTRTDWRIANDPAFQKIVLTGTAQSPAAVAQVYWNESTQELFLDGKSLAALDAAKQYQLWAIVDGKPVDAGVFDPVEGLLKMKNIGAASAFAVTIEPRGGQDAPTLSTMQVLGNT